MIFIQKQKRLGHKRFRQKINHHDFLQSQIDIQEQTFQQISTEIHDNISLTLSLSKIYLHDLNFSDHADMSDKINLSVSLIKKAIGDLNSLSKSLNADTIEKFGLIKSIEEQVNDIRKAELFNINFQVNGPHHLPVICNELILFRMIQESLNNIIRHANATEVNISLEYERTGLTVRVHDNGSGFSTENILSNKKGFGLSNMRKRARLINAQLLVESQPQNGTTIKIHLPLNNNQTN